MEPIEQARQSKEYKERKAAGVDVEALLKAASESDRYNKYKSPATRLSILMSAIIPLREPPKGEDFDEELLVLAGSDRYGQKFPVKFIAMRKNKKFCFINEFDANKFPGPCKCRVVGKSVESAYGMDVTPIDGGISAIEPKTFEEVQKVIQKVQLTTNDWDKLENLRDGNKNEIAVFRGRIKSVWPIAVFGAKSEQTGKASKVGELDALSPNERSPASLNPTMQIKLDYNGGFEVAANLEQQHHGAPIYQIEDFEALCVDAMELPKEEQMEFIRSGIVGRDVLLVMNVWGNKETGEKRYITGSCPFIMEALDMPVNDAREQLPTEDKPSPSPSKKSDLQYVDDIVTACLTLNQDPEWVPVAKARDIASIPAEVSDNMVGEMKKRAAQIWKDKKGA